VEDMSEQSFQQMVQEYYLSTLYTYLAVQNKLIARTAPSAVLFIGGPQRLSNLPGPGEALQSGAFALIDNLF
jgi:hypothetical protein